MDSRFHTNPAQTLFKVDRIISVVLILSSPEWVQNSVQKCPDSHTPLQTPPAEWDRDSFPLSEFCVDSQTGPAAGSDFKPNQCYLSDSRAHQSAPQDCEVFDGRPPGRRGAECADLLCEEGHGCVQQEGRAACC